MSSTYHDLETLKKFLEDHVCKYVMFKVPDEFHEDETYRLAVGHPKVFIENTEKKVCWAEDQSYYAYYPQIVIRCLGESENRYTGERTYQINLLVITWNTGIHGDEIYYPENSDFYMNEKGIGTLRKYETSGNPNTFMPSNDGYKDVLNLCDMIAEQLETHLFLGENLSMVHQNGIESGILWDQEGPARTEPYWIHWLEFSIMSYVERPLVDAREGL